MSNVWITDSFAVQVQCEEFSKWDLLMDLIDDLGSEDVLDRCEVVSLQGLDEVSVSYDAEDSLIEAVDHEWLFDQSVESIFEDLLQTREVPLRRVM